MIVDSHTHVSAGWYEPVETLLAQMDRNGVQRAVLVQILGQTDNSYQQDCLARFPDRFMSVVGIDPEQPDAAAALTRAVENGASGVRLRPGARSAGADPLELWRTAAALNVSVSCVGTLEAFTAPAFADLLGEVPDTRIVLEHLGGLARPDAPSDSSMRIKLLDLADCPNIFLKLPGAGQLAQRDRKTGIFDHDRAKDVLAPVVERFGPDRLMWGSDHPVVSSREGYRNALQWMRDLLGDLPAAAHDSIFGNTALELFSRARLEC